jgi:hypothetical protein
MGNFLENLKKQIAIKDVVSRKQESERPIREVQERDRLIQAEQQKNKERREREQAWGKAKAHFEESGVRNMLEEIIAIKAAKSTEEDKDNKNHYGYFGGSIDIAKQKWIEHKDQPPKENFTIWLTIEETSDYSLTLRVVASADGALTFCGEHEEAAIPKSEWEKNGNILEEALEGVYRRPHRLNFNHDPGPSLEERQNGMSSG